MISYTRKRGSISKVTYFPKGCITLSSISFCIVDHFDPNFNLYFNPNCPNFTLTKTSIPLPKCHLQKSILFQNSELRMLLHQYINSKVMFLQLWQSCSSLRNSDRYLDNTDRYLDISDRYLDITGNVILFIDACVFTLPANIRSCSHIVLLVRAI